MRPATADGVRPALAGLLPDFRARALEAERLGTMPADLVRRAQAAGLFRLNLPRSLGGLELDPASTTEIFEEISRADGSAGWTVAIGNSTAFFAWLYDTIAQVWATACRGNEPDLGQRALVLLAANQAVRAATEAVDRIFRLAGAEAVYTHHPLQRCFRDVHAAGQHVLFGTGREQAYAKVRFGLDQPAFLI
jgi:alkylation response protein AidB-like acyl-CoA dehydrogenase